MVRSSRLQIVICGHLEFVAAPASSSATAFRLHFAVSAASALFALSALLAALPSHTLGVTAAASAIT